MRKVYSMFWMFGLVEVRFWMIMVLLMLLVSWLRRVLVIIR